MVDPLTCLGIACNVMQVISFSHEIYSVVERIKEDGSVDEELRQHVDHITESSKGLENYLDRIADQQLPRNQTNLRNIASKCLKTSKKIQTKLDRIDNTRGGLVPRAVKLFWRKDALERLEKDMQDYQDAMQSQILSPMLYPIHDRVPYRNVSFDQNEAANLVQEDKLRSLDQVLQNFIKAYSQGQTEFKDLISSEAQTTQSLIATEHEETRAYTRTTQEDIELRRNLEKKREQLLKSLKDHSMNARKNQLEATDGVTFSSVFDAETETPWQSFTHWLRSDDPLYWISGKAGSGKSTLLNFLFEDERTKEQLNNWSTDCAIYVHFIWSSGTPSQRSISGLLRSLLYQILAENETIMDSLRQEHVRLSNFTTPDDWSRKDLEIVLVKSLSLHERGVCIFIDGLDEIDQNEGPFDLLELVERISHSPSTKGVKLCVSSRPELTFSRGLERCPQLKLQDITHQDMRTYVNSFLQANPFDFEEMDEKQFVDTVVSKAEGVFLWVSLVLKSLQRGVANGDDPKELMQRLETLPSELGKLFKEMLKRIGDDQPLYAKEAALYFNIWMDFEIKDFIFSGEATLFNFAAAVDPTLRDKLLTQKLHPSPETINGLLLAAHRRLLSRCAGLLETITAGEEKDIEKILSRQTPKPWEGLRVALIHRSAKDFLLNKEDMILDPDKTTPAERKVRILQAIALDDLYPADPSSADARQIDNHNEGRFSALGFSSLGELGLSSEQQSEIFDLTKTIYQHNGWPDIYEAAARVALDHCLERLREGIYQNQKAVQNYMLLCVDPEWQTK
ncbi:Vegetative incompatibility protein [Lachnellula occidentalis]|uniref:Vegetative incompatibility protein n=1 Tax=Lachnellula occidentalis TaxID=215460 RepID=A0A8H8UIH3_9HELO|nr:Vegetative incompatibility protein [Lachnellula occidentalis]